MVNAEFLTQIEADLALDSKSIIARAVVRGSGHRYFADWVRDRAVAYSGYIAKDRKVYTTFKPRLQQLAEKSIAAGLRLGSKKGVQQAAMVVLDKKGAVLAMVGGKSYTSSQFNRATQALRQPGSALKPIVYLAALNEGYKPSSIISDTPLTIGSWSPKNFDGRFRKNVTLTEALVMSLNVPTVRLSERIGRQHSIDLARKLGITSELKNEPSLALGANEVTLLELTSAYVAFSNGGYPISPYGIENVTVPGDGIIYKNQIVNQPSVAKIEKIEMIHELLSDVIRRGTGKRAGIENDAAGKTGTSQGYRDAWFIGYSGNLIAGIWLGRDDSKSMAKVTGGGLPAEIWSNFMQKATEMTN
jgi:penicillin-binding protein 1A